MVLIDLFVSRCCALQADSEQLKQAWLSALQGSIDLAYRERSDTQLMQAGPHHDHDTLTSEYYS